MSMDRPPNKLSSFQRLQMETKKVQKSDNKPTNSRIQKGNNPSSSSSKICQDHPNTPDRRYGDYYCKICDSHMNSEGMWDAHIIGRRHLKNVKKGDKESKYEEIHVESDIKHELRNVKDPVVGLSYIHEIRRREPGVPPYYNCFLCHASIATVPLVIEHVLSLKHRQNYLKEKEPGEFEQISATKLKKGHLEPLVHDAVVRCEEKYGRGTVEVKQEKPKKLGPYKRHFASSSDDDDHDYKNRSKEKKMDSLPSFNLWQSVNQDPDTGKKVINRFKGSGSHKESARKMSSPPDEYKRSRSPGRYNSCLRDTDFRHSEYDNYPSNKSDLRDSKYSRSTDHEPKPQARKQDRYGPTGSYTSQSVSLSHEIQEDRLLDSLSNKVSENMLNLPDNRALKIILHRVRKIDNNQIGSDEIDLLSALQAYVNDLMLHNLRCGKYGNLSRQMKDSRVFQEKRVQDFECSSQRSNNTPYGPGLPPPLTQTAILSKQSESNHRLLSPVERQSVNLEFIRDILKTAHSANAASSSSQSTANQHPSIGSYQTPDTNYQNQSAIPGLTLSENEATETQQYYTYQAHYSSSNPDARQNYPYGY